MNPGVWANITTFYAINVQCNSSRSHELYILMSVPVSEYSLQRPYVPFDPLHIILCCCLHLPFYFHVPSIFSSMTVYFPYSLYLLSREVYDPQKFYNFIDVFSCNALDIWMGSLDGRFFLSGVT